EREVRVLDGLAGGALAEVVDRADHDRLARRLVLEEGDLGRVGGLHARELRRDAFREHADDAAGAVGIVEPLPQVVGRRLRVTGSKQPAPDRYQVRYE